MKNKKILLAYGSGGKLMHQLIEDLFLKNFNNEIIEKLDDSASLPSLSEKFDICFTTDSYTVDPVFFPGGDIGKLSVCGTINDLSVCGAKPLFISCSFIIEEGFDFEDLEKIVDSMRKVSETTGVKIVTGDTKVVEKGKADKIFINTSGIGIKDKNLKLGKEYIEVGDKVIISGTIGDHEISIISKRLNFETEIESDCAPLNKLISEIIKEGEIKFMRDPTRGGIATTLNEIVKEQNFGILIERRKIPVREEVKSICEILGIDPLYLANEGKVLIVCKNKDSEKILRKMKENEYGKNAQIIGEIVEEPKGKVLLETEIGSKIVIDMLSGGQYPRIC
ncbi:MAG: hydrogenase expression/formation protein HypE [Candidatus Omnitrophota bacterium]|nr:MAG: hydrogenase expression/formation protein HypE [Candidatus Omnitrophota bacterium]